ncbi:MAG: Glu/Leu/Phe/Val dehydrogenase dimerization domain-containing protein [Acidimicrobiales bacterium]
MSVTWTDEVTGRRGYLVIDRTVRGLGSGGLRMRAGCSLDEVRGLAEAMTYKEALNYTPGARYIPLGGAKGGVDCDPRDPGAQAMLTRYLIAVRPYLERYWATGEDLGLTQAMIDRAVSDAGLQSSIQAIYPYLDDRSAAARRLAAGFAVTVDGIGLDTLVGGYGVAAAALTTLDELGRSRDQTRAFVQGFGSMGGATARYLAGAGVRVVGVSDADGVVANPEGLDVERLLRNRDELGSIDRAGGLGPADATLPRDAWLDVDAELLVPAAVSYSIDDHNEEAVRAQVVVEAANLPVTLAAESALVGRGVTIIPDVVANSATNSWWWWTLFGDIGPTADEAFAKIDQTMGDLVRRVLERAAKDGTTPRAAAHAIGEENLEEIVERFGVYPPAALG